MTYAIGDGQGFQPGEEAHAAPIPPCQQCHNHGTTHISSKRESHKPLKDTLGLKDACVILCHTSFDKSMNFTEVKYVEYNITEVSGNWTVQGFNSCEESNSTVINQTPQEDKHT